MSGNESSRDSAPLSCYNSLNPWHLAPSTTKTAVRKNSSQEGSLWFAWAGNIQGRDWDLAPKCSTYSHWHTAAVCKGSNYTGIHPVTDTQD